MMMFGLDRNYKNIKEVAKVAENAAVVLDLLTLEGPQFPEGPNYLSKREKTELLKLIDSAEFNIKLVKDQLQK